MRLNEILDRPSELRVVKDTDRSYQADATIAGRDVRFKFTRWPGEQKGNWTLTFVQLDELHPDGETYRATGDGGELAVFASAKKFLEDAMAKHDPDAVYFEADKTAGESRAKLYKRFISRWHPPGYEHELVADDGHTDYHRFVKDRA